MTDPLPEPDNLRFLRRLVTALTATMILGITAIVVLMFMRLSQTGPNLPNTLTLPAGATASAYTAGQGWLAVVTDQNQILIYDSATGKLIQQVQVVTP